MIYLYTVLIMIFFSLFCNYLEQPPTVMETIILYWVVLHRLEWLEKSK